MHQQRRLSPAPSSPCPRIQQQSNRMQFLQPQYVVPQQPQYCQQPIVLKTEELRPVQQLHHQSREREKENLNPKAFQSGRLLSQHDTPQHSQRSLQQIPVGAFPSQTSTEAQVKQLREEMLKMFEFSRKDFELVKTELEQSKQELVEQKKINKTFVAQIEGLNQQLVYPIQYLCYRQFTQLTQFQQKFVKQQYFRRLYKNRKKQNSQNMKLKNCRKHKYNKIVSLPVILKQNKKSLQKQKSILIINLNYKVLNNNNNLNSKLHQTLMILISRNTSSLINKSMIIYQIENCLIINTMIQQNQIIVIQLRIKNHLFDF